MELLHEQSVSHISTMAEILCKVTYCTGQSSVVYLLLSCTGMTGSLGVLFHVQNTVRWLALPIRLLPHAQKLLKCCVSHHAAVL